MEAPPYHIKRKENCTSTPRPKPVQDFDKTDIIGGGDLYILASTMIHFRCIRPAAQYNPQLQATLADTVSEVEALKKAVPALQHLRGRAGSSNSSSDRATRRDGADI